MKFRKSNNQNIHSRFSEEPPLSSLPFENNYNNNNYQNNFHAPTEPKGPLEDAQFSHSPINNNHSEPEGAASAAPPASFNNNYHNSPFQSDAQREPAPYNKKPEPQIEFLGEEEAGYSPKKPRRPQRQSSPSKQKKERPTARKLTAWGICVALILTIIILIFSKLNLFETDVIKIPEDAVSSAVTPVQSVFNRAVNAIDNYLRQLKYRGTLESEYNNVTAELENLQYENVMLTAELEQLRRQMNIQEEAQANIEMNPIVCAVVGRDSNNYFSVFTIDKGSNDGIKSGMAVTLNGGLVGYTEDVQPNKSTVRSVIDSQFSIAALNRSSRDQGVVRGTLGTNGEPLCYMYYTTSLPRPGDIIVTSGVTIPFPKEIPIGIVRESTRGMDANKQYIVVEPIVDFSALEYVVVFRYQPQWAEPVSGGQGDVVPALKPLSEPQPTPARHAGNSGSFLSNPEGEGEGEGETPDPDASGAPTDDPNDPEDPNDPDDPDDPDNPNGGSSDVPGEPTPTPNYDDNLSYNPPDLTSAEPTETPEPTESPSPSPTPAETLDFDGLTMEDED